MGLWSRVLERERSPSLIGPRPTGRRLPSAALPLAPHEWRRSHVLQDLCDALLPPHPDAGDRELAEQEVCFSNLEGCASGVAFCWPSAERLFLCFLDPDRSFG